MPDTMQPLPDAPFTGLSLDYSLDRLWSMKRIPKPLLKGCLDGLVERYKTPDFITGDPIQFPHRFADNPMTAEWVGFMAAMFSYGRRETLVENINGVLRRMNQDPAAYLASFNPKRAQKDFSQMVYRFNTGADVVALLARLERIYQDYDSFEAFLAVSMPLMKQDGLQGVLADFMDRFIALGPDLSAGLKFMLAHPARGGACKRLQMYLRWMVRQELDPTRAVDLGLWRNSLRPKDLLVPMDTHVSKMARKFGLTQRNGDDWRTAQEISLQFSRFCPQDPMVYDFALFGLGFEAARRPLSS